MEDSKTSFIDDEIFYYSSSSNFGVKSRNLISPKNIKISFSHLSSNNKISFSNTIMFPFIAEEKKNENTKDSTRTKAESSKKEKNNTTEVNQITKIINNNENDKVDETVKTNDLIKIITIECEEQKTYLENNPFFLGTKTPLNLNYNHSDSNEVEIKKVKALLNQKNKNTINEEDSNFYLKTSKNLRKKSFVENNKIRSSNKIKRIELLNIKSLKEENNKKKEGKEKKERKSKNKYRTHKSKEYKSSNNEKNILKHSDKSLNIKRNKENLIRKKRESTTKSNSPKIKINNKYKSSLFNKNSSSKINPIFDAIQTEKEKMVKFKNNNENKQKGKNSKFISHSINKNFNIRRSDFNFFYVAKIKKVKTKDNLLSESKKNSNLYKKKLSEIQNNLDFEAALKNKKNLSKTQFNLFSPDKFTNTQFCGSDYLEYTLDCMELILKSNKSQKQQKNKVNFNFPKTKGNKLKKIALFDLDETLVHCTGDIKTQNEPYQHGIEIVLPGNKKATVGINIRPFWKKTLNLIKKYYHIVVFTASHQAYADAVLNFMDPSNKYFKYRLYRNNCSLVEVDGNKFYVKDLDIFDEYYNLKDIIIIDNSALSFIYHLENGIPIVPYYNEDKDGSLYVVGLYLIHIFKEDDLREANKKYINLESFLNEAKQREAPESIIKDESVNNIKETNNNSDTKMNNINKGSFNKEEKSIKDSPNNLKDSHSPTPKNSYFTHEHSQSKLINRSKLINMFYEINNNRYISGKKEEEIIEEKSNKSFSIDNGEKEENKNDDDFVGLFFKRRLLTSKYIPIRHKTRNKSTKSLHHYLNTKTIKSNFYYNFSKL